MCTCGSPSRLMVNSHDRTRGVSHVAAKTMANCFVVKSGLAAGKDCMKARVSRRGIGACTIGRHIGTIIHLKESFEPTCKRGISNSGHSISLFALRARSTCCVTCFGCSRKMGRKRLVLGSLKVSPRAVSKNVRY